MNTTPRPSLQAVASALDPSNNSSSSNIASISSSKKKLGQNLSKLTKPPAPPVPTGTKTNSSSRNGLLLLSTKRSSSLTSNSNNVNAASTASAGGILSGKAANTSSTSASSTLTSFSSASTNDYLFQAALGKMDVQHLQQQQQQPDAWGVAAAASTEKHTLQNHVHQQLPFLGEQHQQSNQRSDVKHTEPLLVSQGGVSSSLMQPSGQSRFDQQTTDGSRFESEGRQLSGLNGHRQFDDYNRNRSHYDSNDSSHAYQDKPHATNRNNLPFKQNLVEDQSAFMRERAEARKAEEEARLNEQKERAGQKLRELEEKMARNADKAPVTLEPLGVGAVNGRSHHPSWQSPDRIQQRTLYDPNTMTYSALLGGSNQRVENGEKLAHDETRQVLSSSPPVRKSEVAIDSNGVNQSQMPGPVIHLSSYEDRDRGERGTTAGPRMLFDPKSGAMVAVPTREDGAKARKERPKRIRNERESPSVTVLKKPEPTPTSDYDSDKNHRRQSRNRKEDSWHPKGKGRSDSTDNPARAEKGDHKKKQGNTRKNPERILPRTCGVLYAKDEKGTCYAVDGCDGDLGYGAYSVPGGPTRNPDAYARFLEKHQNYRHDVPDDVVDDYLCDSEPYNSQQEDVVPTLQTGFKIAEPSPAPKIIDWVKPNEKIELVTGVDDSPTLQATAREWAPSRAALAAAAAVAAAGPATTVNGKESKPVIIPTVSPTITKTGIISVEDTQEDEDVPFLGLGFDPTETMDSVMQSPSVRPKAGSFDVDLAALSLEPPMSATNRNIFAFGSSATWGDNGDAGNAGWGDLNNGFLSRKFAKEGKEVAASFLSLSDKAWGGTGVLGLGGAALSGKSVDTTGE